MYRVIGSHNASVPPLWFDKLTTNGIHYARSS